MIRHARLALFVLLALAPSALADRWASYGVRIVSSPDGAWYAIVDGTAHKGGCRRVPSRVHVVRRAEGAPPVATRRASFPALRWVEDGDTRVATHVVMQTPVDTHVMNDGRVVLVDSYASCCRGDLVIVRGADGARELVLSPGVVLPGHAERYRTGSSGTWWKRMTWVDEPSDTLYLLTVADELFAVDLATGDIAEVDLARHLLTGRAPPTPSGREQFWHLVLEHGAPRVEDARRVMDDPDETDAVRIRATFTVAKHTDDRAARDAIADVFEHDRFAQAYAGDVLGADAIPLYEPLLRRTTRTLLPTHLFDGITRASDAGVDALAEWLIEPGEGLGDGDWLVLCAFNHAECGTKTNGTWRVVDSPRSNDQIDAGRTAFLALRDDADLSALDALLTRHAVHHRRDLDAAHALLALPTLELLARRPHPDARDALVRYRALLDEHPHRRPAWNARLVAAADRALAALPAR